MTRSKLVVPWIARIDRIINAVALTMQRCIDIISQRVMNRDSPKQNIMSDRQTKVGRLKLRKTMIKREGIYRAANTIAAGASLCSIPSYRA